MGNDLCTICGVKATQHYGYNPLFPLCSLWSCEQAFIKEMNEAFLAAASAEEQNNKEHNV